VWNSVVDSWREEDVVSSDELSRLKYFEVDLRVWQWSDAADRRMDIFGKSNLALSYKTTTGVPQQKVGEIFYWLNVELSLNELSLLTSADNVCKFLRDRKKMYTLIYDMMLALRNVHLHG
jgi:hypothetical protein